MSGATTRERSRPGRVLTVGDSPALGRLRELLGASDLHASSLFEAIGEVTVARASEAIEAVVIAAETCAGASISGVRALRRVDPSLQLVLLAEAGAATDRATASAFDHCLSDPVDPAALNDALGFRAVEDHESAPPRKARKKRAVKAAPRPEPVDAPAPVAAPAPPNPMPADPPPAKAPAATSSRPSVDPAKESPREEPPLVESVPRSPASTATPPPPKTPRRPVETGVPFDPPLPPEAVVESMDAPAPVAAAPAPASPGGLGDVDLVRAVIDDPDGVRETALHLLREQTGWSDVELIPDEKPVGRAASVPVVRGRRTYGRLVSCHALDRELRPWADWLAHWLALDQHYRDYRTMAYRDELTGAWNRRFFFAFLTRSIERARQQRRTLTLMVFDIDDFKRYNDDYGHAAGDEILVEAVRLLRSVIRKGDRVCRIGGDEFAVVFADPEGPREPGSTHPETVEHIARRFQDQISRMRFPKLGLEAPGTLSISGGLATYPWDGIEPEMLLEHADRLALHSKRTGKNVITFGPGAPTSGGSDRDH